MKLKCLTDQDCWCVRWGTFLQNNALQMASQIITMNFKKSKNFRGNRASTQMHCVSHCHLPGFVMQIMVTRLVFFHQIPTQHVQTMLVHVTLTRTDDHQPMERSVLHTLWPLRISAHALCVHILGSAKISRNTCGAHKRGLMRVYAVQRVKCTAWQIFY